MLYVLFNLLLIKRPDGDNTRDAELRQRYNLARVSGLIRPFPDQSTGTFIQGLTINDVNSDAIRQQIINACRLLKSLFLFIYF